MTLFNPDRYSAVFDESEIVHLPVFNSRGGSVSRHRCLNYTLRVTAPDGSSYLLSGGIAMDRVNGKHAPIVQFLRQIGWFRSPENFDAKELKGHEVLIDSGVLFDKRLGLRSYVVRFYPAEL
jgi:hypothetical protein